MHTAVRSVCGRWPLKRMRNAGQGIGALGAIRAARSNTQPDCQDAHAYCTVLRRVWCFNAASSAGHVSTLGGETGRDVTLAREASHMLPRFLHAASCTTRRAAPAPLSALLAEHRAVARLMESRFAQRKHRPRLEPRLASVEIAAGVHRRAASKVPSRACPGQGS